MRDLFDQGRPLSSALIRSGTSLLGLLLGIAALIVLGQGLRNIFSLSAPFTGIAQISGGLGLLLATYLIVRLLSEAVLALHRLNDRLTVMNSDLGTNRAEPAPTTKPAAKPARRTKAKPATKPTAEATPAKSTSPAEA
ncbi:MAG: hypothetical protein AAFS13_08350 [Pseudomonadota bacterium]